MDINDEQINDMLENTALFQLIIYLKSGNFITKNLLLYYIYIYSY